MIDAGKYNHRIEIRQRVISTSGGFQEITYGELVLACKASIKTTKGFTLIQNNSDFEKAYTNFTIRFPHTAISRDMLVCYRNKIYSIEYLNNVDEADKELEIQAKEITH